MVAILTSVGIAGVVVSLAALGFGFAYNEFGTGNALIGAGASGLGSSLVLIAVGAALRELRRIADALPGRAAVRGQPAPEANASTGSARIAAARARSAPRPVGEELEPRPDFGTDLAPDTFETAEVERSRPNVFAAPRHAVEPPPMAEPMAPMRGPAAAPLGAESSYEPKFGPADILARLGGRSGAPARPDPARDLPRPPAGEPFETGGDRDIPRAEPPSRTDRPERPERPSRGSFETMWSGRQTRSAAAEAAARAPRPETREEPKYEPKSEPAFEPKYEPKRAAVEPPPPSPAESRPASILKSGVIDGMAYTLYTDGSIEAQLPQGTLRFASIEELRVHLERNG